VAMLVATILVAWFYPLNKEKHARMRRLLAKRHHQARRRNSVVREEDMQVA